MVPERTMCWVENNGKEKNRRGRAREGEEGGENIRNKSSNTTPPTATVGVVVLPSTLTKYHHEILNLIFYALL
jgi:hypothetical protein